VPNQSRRLIFGVSVGLPFFNRNQGGKAEAATAISQAQRRREFAEAVVRAEVTSAYTRYEAARAALATFEQGVIARSNENIQSIRGAYEVGAFRITDLLSEQRRLVDLQGEFTEALTERYRALVDLQAAMGNAGPAGENQNPK
jgi:cobalt-zinc-cadmium efflux system outer membrane protein